MQTSSLPKPDSLSLAHQQAVRDFLKQQILASPQEQLEFSAFMQIALYQPGLGYYSAGNRKFGSEGDFITSPEISSLFGKILALELGEYILNKPKYDFLEFGAGSGKFAVDVLDTLDFVGHLPQHYYILEVSPELKQRQKALIEEKIPHLLPKVTWLESLPKQFKGIIFANEVLDAMPFERFTFKNNQFYQHYIKIIHDEFVWHLDTPSPQMEKACKNLQIDFPEGYTSEINLMHQPWINSLSQMLTEGLIILFDYGYPRREYYHPQRQNGTMKCFYQHRQHEDPLVLTGIQDITAHVDFTTIAEAGTDAKLKFEGYTTQGNLLLNMGIEEMLMYAKSDVEKIKLTQELKKLTLPTEMGELFKVIAFSRKLPFPVRGLEEFQLSHTL